MKKEQNGRKSLRRLKLTVGCNASRRRRRRTLASSYSALPDDSVTPPKTCSSCFDVNFNIVLRQLIH